MGNNDFGNFLYRLRRERGVTQAQLADELGLTNKAVSKWETGEAYPETAQLLPLASYFGVTTDELLKGRREGTESSGCGQSDRYANRGASFGASAAGEPSSDTQSAGAQQSARTATGFHYEYKSKRTVGGVPLVHINIGGFGHLNSRAKGIVAIGNIATGVVSIGFVSLGVVSLGLVGLGVLCLGMMILGALSFGGVALGLVAVGGVAIGVLSVGGVAIGAFAVGGVAIGNWAVGGLAIGHDIALGGRAYGYVAIGTRAFGTHVLSCPEDFFGDVFDCFDGATVRAFIETHLPKTPGFLLRLISLAF